MDLLAPTRTRIARIEAAAADALGPAEEHLSDGWRLRFDHGVRRRGNSALAEHRGRRSLHAKIREVVAFFSARGVPARVQLSAASCPARLDDHLAERGWAYEPGARVMFRATAHAGDGPAMDGPGASFTLQVRTTPDDGYRAVQAAVTPGAGAAAPARAEAQVRRGLDPWHVTATDPDGRVISAGLGVHDPGRGLVGIFSLATLPDARGRGAGGWVLATLLARAARAGAAGCYLQVDVRNEPARRIYQRAGFSEHHTYHYRTRA